MGTINNFITDLLDEMIASGATNLAILSGSKPSLMINGVFQVVPGYDQVDKAELLSDLEALDINVDGESKVSFTYIPEPPLPYQFFNISYSHPLGKILLNITQKESNLWAP